ncbi:uncharacterized protein LOC112486376 [Cynoglossus semilaevis]|uniref:uncharacterized protein LOC112486376 n=1 Tax=Cynoglossus semilaevis TaxID=244447 RepID=UPI000D62BB48|nr:uncharacterized protein LOC112486376 [Cynoglossus semilaevis]
MNARCICGKVCKNSHGLKIYLARMKCREQGNILQRTGPDSGETQEEPGQEAPHSAQLLQAVEPLNPCRIVQHKQIEWPSANSQTVWAQFDTDVSQILETTAKREVDKCLETMTPSLSAMQQRGLATVRAGTPRPATTTNHRATQIHKLCQELWSLRKQYKVASEEEKQPLADLRNILRKKLMTLCWAEWHCRRRKERAGKRAAFISNSFIYPFVYQEAVGG